jgi:riboflavin kinase / FMN adenylyltransferase
VSLAVVPGLEALPAGIRVCVTVGVFDGLHRGHQHLLGTLVRAARARDAVPVVVTFDPHPDAVLRGAAPPHLLDPSEALERLEGMGVELVALVRFDGALRAQTAEEFVGRLASGRHLAALVMSSESAFGRDRGGTPDALRDLGARQGWSVVEVAPLSLRGDRVSSGRIRGALEAGRLGEARTLLGRPHALVGTVVHGDGRGRDLGYPTANLAFEEPVCLPADGIYAARSSWGGEDLLRPAERGDAVVSLGTRPTFGPGGRVLEVHLLDRRVDLYGRRLRVELLRKLRGQKRFSGPDALVAQMDRDVLRSRDVLAGTGRSASAAGPGTLAREEG